MLAGELLLSDPAVTRQFGGMPHAVVNAAGTVGAVLVVVPGKLLLARQASRHAV